MAGRARGAGPVRKRRGGMGAGNEGNRLGERKLGRQENLGSAVGTWRLRQTGEGEIGSQALKEGGEGGEKMKEELG